MEREEILGEMKRVQVGAREPGAEDVEETYASKVRRGGKERRKKVDQGRRK